MPKGREIISLPVVTINQRKQIGEVKDLIYDPSANRLLGYLVECGNWLKDGSGFLHSDVVRREENCLVVRDESVIRNLSSIPELKQALDGKKDIRGRPVECGSGRQMGIIQDLVLDEKTSEITGYEVSDGVVQDLLEGRVTIPNKGINIYDDKIVTSEGEISSPE